MTILDLLAMWTVLAALGVALFACIVGNDQDTDPIVFATRIEGDKL